MKPKISLLIHGPYADSAYVEIFRELTYISREYKDRLSIVIVCYENEKKKTEENLEKTGFVKYKMVTVKDIVNPGFFNINRQIICVRRGLQEVEPESFVIKLRNDQWISFNKLFEILEARDYLKKGTQKILTTNCYTRSDRLYHPSDMFLCAWKEELDIYYSCPIQTMTHMDCQMAMVEKASLGEEPFENYFVCPEIILFRHYLKEKGWEFKNTKEDSYAAIAQWCVVINSWDIMYRWNKERPPQFKRGSIILPYPFVVEPFQGAPVEHAEYYGRHDFQGKLTKKDKKYLNYMKKEKNKNLYPEKNKILGKIRRFISKHPVIKRILLKGKLGDLSRKLYVKSFE